MSVHRRPAGPCEVERPALAGRAHDWQLRAAEFARAVVAPLGLALDRLSPARVAAPSSPLHDFIAQANCERFTRLTDSAADGGAGLSRATEYLVLEELATADAGLAALLIAAPLPFRWAHAAGADSLDARLARPYLRGSVAGLSGCVVGPAAATPPRARRDGRGWRLSCGPGSLGAPVLGAAVATHAALPCSSPTGPAVVVLPLTREGVKRRLPVAQAGLRAGAPAVVELSEVAIQPDELIGPGGHHRGGRHPGGHDPGGRDPGRRGPGGADPVAVARMAGAIVGVGIARAAYEEAARWVAERGLPASHRVALMRGMLERARSLTRSAHCYTHRRLDAGQPALPQHAMLASRLAARTAAELARQLQWIVGADGRRPGGVEHLDGSQFWPEKLLRDAGELSLACGEATRAAPLRSIHPPVQRSATWGL